eukprot:912427-Rhodomonas_salina.3
MVLCEMCGTELAYGAMRIWWSTELAYGRSNELAYGATGGTRITWTSSSQPTRYCTIAPYASAAVCGTELAYGAMRMRTVLTQQLLVSTYYPICLRACYASICTEIAYGATRLLVRARVWSGTGIAYGATRDVRIIAYAPIAPDEARCRGTPKVYPPTAR